MATLFVGVLIMTRIDSDAWQQWFLISTLSMVVFLNICTAIYQGGLIGWATLEIKQSNLGREGGGVLSCHKWKL